MFRKCEVIFWQIALLLCITVTILGVRWYVHPQLHTSASASLHARARDSNSLKSCCSSSDTSVSLPIPYLSRTFATWCSPFFSSSARQPLSSVFPKSKNWLDKQIRSEKRFRVYHSKMHLYGQAWRMWYKQAWRGSNVSPHIPTIPDFVNIDFWIGNGGLRNPSIIAGMIWSGLFSTTSAKLSIPHLLQLQLSFSFHIRLYIDLDQLIWNHGSFTWNAKSSESSNHKASETTGKVVLYRKCGLILSRRFDSNCWSC